MHPCPAGHSSLPMNCGLLKFSDGTPAAANIAAKLRDGRSPTSQAQMEVGSSKLQPVATEPFAVTKTWCSVQAYCTARCWAKHGSNTFFKRAARPGQVNGARYSMHSRTMAWHVTGHAPYRGHVDDPASKLRENVCDLAGVRVCHVKEVRAVIAKVCKWSRKEAPPIA